MPSHPFGWLSLLPPLIAILLAIATRRVLVALLAGIVTGSLLFASGNPVRAVEITCEGLLWPSLADGDHLRVFAFTAMMGAMVGVMQHAGGFTVIVKSLSGFARNRRRGQLVVWGLGLIVFFDDYANSLLLGNTMRPLADRLGLSREKLAYLVDSTAAPVSGLAVISTWVAGEIGFIEDGFAAADASASVDGFAIFLATIPYRFYVLWALACVPLVALLGRDLGPMRRAEDLARARAAEEAQQSPKVSMEETTSGSWADAVFPILAVIGVTIGLILVTGSRKLSEADPSGRDFLSVFGAGDSYLALVYGAAAGLGTAILLAIRLPGLTIATARRYAAEGAAHVVPALLILWLAWALSDLTGKEYLGTGRYLAGMLRDTLDVRWMPTAVFILASLVAFATGTSWGTMGILMPLVIGATLQMLDAGSGPEDPLLIAVIGSVLAGAIFGDHCSPISDTTVLSSQASGCSHIAHVRTQLPYALLVGAVSVCCGTLPVGFGVPVWFLCPTGVVVLAVLVRVLGRPPESV